MPNLSLLEPKSLTEAMEFSDALSKSGLVPDAYRGKPANILVAIQWGYEIGLPPMQSLSNINIINGKATLWGDGLVAVCKKHPDYYGMKEWLEGDTAYCSVKRKVKDQIEETVREFSLDDATKAGLNKKGGAWQTYPKRMLQQRARGFALRDAFPDAIKGIITTEEAVDFPEDAKTSDLKLIHKPLITNDADLANSIVDAFTDDNIASNDIVEDKQEETNTFEIKLLNNKPSEIYNNLDEAINRYKEIMSAVYSSSKIQPENKRTMLKDFEHINLDLINRQFPQEKNTEVKQQRLDFNKALSVQAQENQNG